MIVRSFFVQKRKNFPYCNVAVSLLPTPFLLTIDSLPALGRRARSSLLFSP